MAFQHRARLAAFAVTTLALLMEPAAARARSYKAPATDVSEDAPPRNPNLGLDIKFLSANGPKPTSKFAAQLGEAVGVRVFRYVPAEVGPPQFKTGTVGVQFVLHRDGSVTDVNLTRSSGDAALDAAARKAILSCGGAAAGSAPQTKPAPLLACRCRCRYPAFPPTYPEGELKVRLTFLYNYNPNPDLKPVGFKSPVY